MLDRVWRKGNPLALLMLMESDIATMEDGRKKKLGLKPPCDSAIPPLGIYLEETKTEKKNPCTPMFIAALLIVIRTWKQPRCSLTKEASIHNGAKTASSTNSAGTTGQLHVKE